MQKEIKPISMQPLADRLNIENTQIIDVTDIPDDLEQRDDYAYARENIMDIIEKGKDALDDIIAIGKSTEHARSYEVVSTLINTLIVANEKLLDVKKKQKELEKKTSENDKDSNTNITNNNAVFVGSTAELQKIMKQLSSN